MIYIYQNLMNLLLKNYSKLFSHEVKPVQSYIGQSGITHSCSSAYGNFLIVSWKKDIYYIWLPLEIKHFTTCKLFFSLTKILCKSTLSQVYYRNQGPFHKRCNVYTVADGYRDKHKSCSIENFRQMCLECHRLTYRSERHLCQTSMAHLDTPFHHLCFLYAAG